MQEKAASHLVEFFAQKGGQDQQVVVMDPDVVVIHAHDLHQLVCKDLQQREAAVNLTVGEFFINIFN